MPNANGSQQPCFLGFGTIKECPNMCNKGKCGYAPNDKAWEEFLDVLTGKRSSAECPTLEELELECLHQLYEEVNGDA